MRLIHRHRSLARSPILLSLTLVAALVAGCSSDETSSETTLAAAVTSSGAITPETEISTADTEVGPTSTVEGPATTAPPASSAATESAACAAPDDTTPTDATDRGNGRDYDVTSFDGTVIRTHWFPLPGLGADETAPTVLMGPGWGSPGDTDVSAVGSLGALEIASLRGAGYNVLTWDPRGFGDSTGVVTIDSVDFEGRDVQELIDWVSTLSGVALDGDRDPRMGMVGGSYGGGIQLVTAPVDCRIDALVPVIAWNSLSTSLYKNETPKTGWTNLLVTATFGAALDPTITRAQQAGNTTGTLDPADAAWLEDRGPGEAVADIGVPTLLIQGTVDTLFTLDEAIANYHLLRESGVPAAMEWFCGGHGVCLTDPGDTTSVATSAIAWLDRHVRGDTAVDTGPGFRFVDQDGVQHAAAEFTEGSGGVITAMGSGTLALVPEGGSGPAVVDQTAGLLGTFISQITPGPASNSVSVEIGAEPAATADRVVVGSPDLTLTYTGTPGTGERPARVFAQLLDPMSGRVIGNQVTPIPVVLDGEEHTVTVPLESIAFTLHPGAVIELQLVASTVAYAQPQFGGSVTFDAIKVALPVSSDLSTG